MALFKKNDMEYDDYDWKAKYEHDDPKVTGQPDNTLFARKEGYEMLYLVNAFADANSFKQIASCKKAEKLIREKLPSEIRSQIKVKEWLRTNWNK